MSSGCSSSTSSFLRCRVASSVLWSYSCPRGNDSMRESELAAREGGSGHAAWTCLLLAEPEPQAGVHQLDRHGDTCSTGREHDHSARPSGCE
jgi:hypothetical protein